MDDSFKRLKLDLKRWETCFEKYHKRKPTKVGLFFYC